MLRITLKQAFRSKGEDDMLVIRYVRSTELPGNMDRYISFELIDL
jgi:hypothetical protein